jgi:hypothetical protein
VAMMILDGIVLARSVFHHSMNYRSVVLHGRARCWNPRTKSWLRSKPSPNISPAAAGPMRERRRARNSRRPAWSPSPSRRPQRKSQRPSCRR